MVAWCGCSCSYSEQYLQNYFGHSGPLYQIQWSPFAPGLFLSASADWTVKLWAEENPTALITFQVSPPSHVSNTAFSAIGSSAVFHDY
jgi:WD40 repeat protein